MTRPTNEVEFLRRYTTYRGTQVDNSSLPAGSPMYYYCKGCGISTDIRAESWLGSPPPRYCEACSELSKVGSLDRLQTEAQTL